MLHIALAPAAVTLQTGQQMGRRFLVTALKIISLPYFKAAPAHQGGLNGVVAENPPSQRPKFRQFVQGAILHEGAQADDGIMTPIGAVPQLPEIRPGREHRPIYGGAKLLDSLKKTLAESRL